MLYIIFVATVVSFGMVQCRSRLAIRCAVSRKSHIHMMLNLYSHVSTKTVNMVNWGEHY